MNFNKKAITILFCFLVVALTATAVSAKSKDKKDDNGGSTEFPVHIKNFGRVNDFYYRGAQPEREEYAELAKLGVKTVIDLRDEPATFAATSAEAAGLRYISFPLSDTKYPAADVANKFLSIVTDEANWPVYVHCAGGRHRTGAMTAVYRMTIDGGDTAKAYDEMKKYDFYTRWGHGSIKDYVFDYGSANLEDKRTEWYAKGKAIKSSLALGGLKGPATATATQASVEQTVTPQQ